MSYARGVDHDGLLEGFMSDKIEPALAPAEWHRRAAHVGPNAKVGLSRAALHLELRYSSFSERRFEAFDSHDRHVLAALSLHGQPFGFTREDVAALRTAIGDVVANAFERGNSHDMRSVSDGTDPTVARLETLIDRVEALLPPE